MRVVQRNDEADALERAQRECGRRPVFPHQPGIEAAVEHCGDDVGGVGFGHLDVECLLRLAARVENGGQGAEESDGTQPRNSWPA